MVDAALSMDLLIIALLIAGMARSYFSKEEVHQRLDDVITGVDLFATELLNRTKLLLEMGNRLNPAIELHNHNPLEQIFKFVQSMKTGNFQSDNITNPRDSAGQYATAPQIEAEEISPEIVDVID
jgi:hypothetical protein